MSYAGRIIGTKASSRQSIFPAEYYKLVVDAVRTSGNYVQLSEFQLNENGVWLSGSTFSNGNGSSPSGREQPQDANDGSTSTKWLNFQGAGTILLITYPSPVTVTDYTWWTANDVTGRDMISWTLSASKDNSEWIVIDQVVNFSVTTTRFANVGTFYIDSGL